MFPPLRERCSLNLVPAEHTQPFLSLLFPSLPLATTWPLLPTDTERESPPVWRVREADSIPIACHFWKLLRAAGQGVLQEPVCQMKTASCRGRCLHVSGPSAPNSSGFLSPETLLRFCCLPLLRSRRETSISTVTLCHEPCHSSCGRTGSSCPIGSGAPIAQRNKVLPFSNCLCGLFLIDKENLLGGQKISGSLIMYHFISEIFIIFIFFFFQHL